MSVSRILSRLRHKGQITEEEYRKLMDIKNSERHTQRVIEDIKAEIKNERDDIACGVMAKYSSDEAYYNALGWVLNIIDKHIGADMRGAE